MVDRGTDSSLVNIAKSASRYLRLPPNFDCESQKSKTYGNFGYEKALINCQNTSQLRSLAPFAVTLALDES